MTTQRKPYVTPEQYLALERAAPYKSEHFAGEVLALAGASFYHNLIAMNVAASLHAQLRGGPCAVSQSDLRVQVQATGLYTYPDIVVVCGEPRFADSANDTLLNPTVILEVLSPSTEAYDRGFKLEQYRKLDALTDYVLIAQAKPLIEHYARQAGAPWLYTTASEPEEAIALPVIGAVLNLAEVYERVSFEAS